MQKKKKNKKKIRKKIIIKKTKRNRNKKKTKKKKSFKTSKKFKVTYKRKIKKKKSIKTSKKFKVTYKKKTKKSFILNLIRFQQKLKPNLKIKIDFLNIDRSIQKFFQKIDDKIQEFKKLRLEENQRLKIEEFERREKEKKDLEEEQKNQENLILKIKEKELKEEKKLEKERNKDLKKFLRQEQAIVRKEQAERQKRFLEELKIEKQIEKFRIREIKELEKLEKISLKEKRDDYSGLQERIDNLKQKYQLIRDQKIRERVEALGVEVTEGDDRETLLQKEKNYNLQRQKIENALESFYRSANSLVFQLNKRHITRHMSIFRCIDRRFENGEVYIKWDEDPDDHWLILIYIKDNSPDKGIVIEDKSNPEKNVSNEFKPSEIFKASDMMVDSLTQLLERERKKREN
tara:strand:- start:2411 stop:3619 length:1209 start_codon:yes stop_codon:yes gene_type:complete